MRETAAASCVQCCTHDCDKLGGSGQCPPWHVKGERHTQTLPICSAALQSCRSAAIKEACHIQASLEGERRKDGQQSLGPSLRVSQTETILTLLGHRHSIPSAHSNPVLGKCQSKGGLPPTTCGRKGFAALETLPVSESTPGYQQFLVWSLQQAVSSLKTQRCMTSMWFLGPSHTEAGTKG